MAEFTNAQSVEAQAAETATGNSGGSPSLTSGEMTLLPLSSGMGYFQAVPRLNELRNEVSQYLGPSAYDLVKQLDNEALKAGFEPVGANCRGITVDDFFKSNTAFAQLEEQLAVKLVAENVSEVFELIKDASHYKPSRRIVNTIEGIYLRLLEQNRTQA